MMTAEKRTSGGGSGSRSLSLLESLPNSLVLEILGTLDIESLSSAACVCTALRSSVSQILSSSFPTLDLSFFSPDAQTMNRIHYRLGGLKSMTLDCLHLDKSVVNNFLRREIQELSLLKGSLLSNEIFASIGQSCPDLRVLMLQLGSSDSLELYKTNLARMLNGCSCLESLCIKVRGMEFDAHGFQFIQRFLPKSLKVLKLKPLYTEDAIQFTRELRDDRNVIVSLPQTSPYFGLQSLSFLVDYISDGLIMSITNSLPSLVELELEDIPSVEPHPAKDLTNHGLQSLRSCPKLTSLSLVRSWHSHPVSFKRVNDMGILLLSECCRGLLSVKLGGFSVVSDAGFASILHCCRHLQKFEVRKAPLLSDLAFHNVGNSLRDLVDVKLWSCGLVTSETVNELASCSKLEVLDLSGSKSIADGCLSSISSFGCLTSLSLEGADVTDSGMDIIGRGNSPITNIRLRRCKRISDKGVALLLSSGGIISKTLTSLDIGYISGISDEAIFTVAEFGLSITDLCIRYCFHVTGNSLKALGSKDRHADGKKLIRRLDLCHCEGLSVESLESVKKPSFRSLRWLGVGCTKWDRLGESESSLICEKRPWLTVCREGCEMGCIDGWQFHKSD